MLVHGDDDRNDPDAWEALRHHRGTLIPLARAILAGLAINPRRCVLDNPRGGPGSYKVTVEGGRRFLLRGDGQGGIYAYWPRWGTVVAHLRTPDEGYAWGKAAG